MRATSFGIFVFLLAGCANSTPKFDPQNLQRTLEWIESTGDSRGTTSLQMQQLFAPHVGAKVSWVVSVADVDSERIRLIYLESPSKKAHLVLYISTLASMPAGDNYHSEIRLVNNSLKDLARSLHRGSSLRINGELRVYKYYFSESGSHTYFARLLNAKVARHP